MYIMSFWQINTDLFIYFYLFTYYILFTDYSEPAVLQTKIKMAQQIVTYIHSTKIR